MTRRRACSHSAAGGDATAAPTLIARPARHAVRGALTAPPAAAAVLDLSRGWILIASKRKRQGQRQWQRPQGPLSAGRRKSAAALQLSAMAGPLTLNSRHTWKRCRGVAEAALARESLMLVRTKQLSAAVHAP
jgi:hypothetical protein